MHKVTSIRVCSRKSLSPSLPTTATTVNTNQTTKAVAVFQTTIKNMATVTLKSKKRSIQYGINVDALENNVYFKNQNNFFLNIYNY